MALQEKLRIKDLQEVTFPDRQKELLEITGSPIVYDVDWQSFADDMHALKFLDNLSCHRINMALRSICHEPMVRDAIRDGLKRIKLKNVKDTREMKISLGDGVMEMHLAYALQSDGMFTDNEIRDILLKGL